MNFHLSESVHQLNMSEMSDKMNEKGSLDLWMQIILSPGDKDEGNSARQKLL